jgi:hypothetical protein
VAQNRDKAIETVAPAVTPNEWTHLAATYNASNAMKLDGEGYVDCGNDATLDITEALTVEAWVTPASAGQPQVILSKWGGTEDERSWQLYIDKDGKPCFETQDRSHKKTLVKAEPPPGARSYHLVGRYDVSTEKHSVLNFAGNAHVDMGAGIVLANSSFSVSFWARRSATNNHPRRSGPADR